MFATLAERFHSSIARASNPNASNRTHPARDRQTGILLLRFKVFLPTMSQSQSWKTHVPLNAPTGLRTGAATASIIRCEVWKPRRAEIWAKLVAGRAKAALRSAEGMRKAMVVFVLFERVCLGRCGCSGVDCGSVVCYARVRSCEGGDGMLAGAWMVVSSEVWRA